MYAIIESSIPNAGYRIGNGHAREAVAIIESRTSNAGHRIGDGHAHESAAALKSPIPDAGNRIGGTVVGDSFRNGEVASRCCIT